MAKKITRPLMTYETSGKVNGRADTYARITESVMLSPAFQDLTPHLQMLYVAMRLQDIGKRKPNRDYDENSPIWEEVRSEQCFYFNRKIAEQYFPQYKNNSGRLYQDIKALADHGFIDLVVSGKATRDKSIYRYSDRWHNWEPPGG